MDAAALLDGLGYAESRSFLPGSRVTESVEYSHVFQRALTACKVHGGDFHGVYQLRENGDASVSIPLIYVLEAPSVEAADGIHHKIWNQNVAPFLLTRLPTGVRLYSGFRYQPAHERPSLRERGVLHDFVAFDEVFEALGEFHAKEVDNGTLWRVRGSDVDPSTRVDWRLLHNLERLGGVLRGDGLDVRVAHALIGKFVYLRYLRDRGILSGRRLAQFGVDPEHVFGRKVTAKALRSLIAHVDEWLNGKVFPLSFSGRKAPSAAQIRQVAGVFLGDDAESGQLHLDLRAYDFSYIPIETLSVIYEQFLATENRAKKSGAYYTPIALVNFVLAQLEDIHPLTEGTQVLDPSCGSGAFLVQCYRRLIETVMQDSGCALRPQELRQLLTRNIFGVDRDGDACRVTELSLILTMLDYIDPPDLLGSAHAFKLPHLHDENIFEGDFFDSDGTWAHKNANRQFDWIVGNPPWTKLSPKTAGDEPHVGAWISENGDERPIAGGRIAEAFAWKVLDHARASAAIGFVLPAMTFVSEKTAFRERFFSDVGVIAVANFTNLREVLFAGRSREPAAVMFCGPEKAPSRELLVYSPLVANQEVTRPPSSGQRMETWALTVNRSELRTMSVSQAIHGAREWHLAMWGSTRDRHLLRRIEKRLPSLDSFCRERGFALSEGLQLREASSKGVEHLPEVIGKDELVMTRLRNLGRLHRFPPTAIRKVSASRAYVREGRGKKPLAVCHGPHVIVSATRNWAVYVDDFLVVPPRQIGLTGSASDRDLLRAFALYLNSDFVQYHQFFDATQSVVRDGLATLASFKRIPTPLADLGAAELAHWADLHREFEAVARDESRDLFDLEGPRSRRTRSGLEDELNALVGDLLALSELDRALVSDLVHVRMALVDGRVGEAAVGPPTPDQMHVYAQRLGQQLDEFLATPGLAHAVTVSPAKVAGVVRIELIKTGGDPITVLHGAKARHDMLRMAHRHIGASQSQWIYFDRNLLLFTDDSVLLLKPMQRLWWTQSQACVDADEIIATTLVAAGGGET